MSTGTRALEERVRDIAVPGPGVGFDLTRSYRSSPGTVGVLGRGRTFPYSARLRVAASSVTYVAEDGSEAVYARGGDGLFASTAAAGYRLRQSNGRGPSFDSAGRLTAWRNAAAAGLSFSYSGDGTAPTGIVDSVGRAYGLTYGDGRLTRVGLPDGRSVSYGFDGSGLLTRITDPSGRVTMRTEYDADGLVARQIDAVGRTSTFVDVAVGEEREVDYTDATGGVRTDVYVGGVLHHQIDPYGATTTFRYTQRAQLESVWDARGNVTSYAYDAVGRLTGTRDAAGGTTAYGCDAAGHLTWGTDARGGTTSMTCRSGLSFL